MRRRANPAVEGGGHRLRLRFAPLLYCHSTPHRLVDLFLRERLGTPNLDGLSHRRYRTLMAANTTGWTVLVQADKKKA